MDFNYEIINEAFENDKILVVILKFPTLTILKTIVKFDPNSNLKIVDLSNNKFKSISNEVIVLKHGINKFMVMLIVL